MTEQEYRAHKALNISKLSLINESPLHYKIGDRPKTKAMSFGTTFHMAILEPAKFKASYAVEPDTINGEPRNNRLKAHKEYIEAWRLDHSECTILTPEEYKSLLGMIHALREQMNFKETEDLSLAEILKMEHRELPVFKTMFGRECKGLMDVAGTTRLGKTVVDFKKVGRLGDAAPSKFSSTVSNRHYDAQAYWYSQLYGADAFYWVVVEETPIHPDYPHHSVAIYNAEPFLEIGEKKVKKWIKTLEECERLDQWPSYTKGAEKLWPSSWQLKQLEDETW
jgi:hypothetical protein